MGPVRFERLGDFLKPRVIPFLVGVVVILMIADFGSAVAEDPQPRRMTLDRYGITIEYRAKDQKVAEKVASICTERLPDLSHELGLDAVKPFHVFLIPDMPAYRKKLGLRVPEWGVAFAFTENQIMLVDVVKAANAWNSLEKVIPHELSHLLLAQRVEGVRFPLWFMEGLAQWQAHEWSILESWRLMEAVWGNRAPSLAQISSSLPANETQVRDAYRVAYAAFLHRFEERTELIPAFLNETERRRDFGEAFEAFWGESEFDYYARFAEHLSAKYRSRLMLFQTGPLFTLMAVLFLIVMLRIWIRNRKKLRQMDRIERRSSLDDY
ncbi:MAG: hypothetical protein JSW58_06420 [Candidatus Latescibacterota bacterium]|nr:MAG: hypothetical protein JSW58_06420 [Candidatus Latescibacterota bacterium]